MLSRISKNGGVINIEERQYICDASIIKQAKKRNQAENDGINVMATAKMAMKMAKKSYSMSA